MLRINPAVLYLELHNGVIVMTAAFSHLRVLPWLSVLQLLSGAPVSQLVQFLDAFTDGDQLWRLAGA